MVWVIKQDNGIVGRNFNVESENLHIGVRIWTFQNGCGDIFLWIENCVKKRGEKGHQRMIPVVYINNDHAVHVLIYKNGLCI